MKSIYLLPVVFAFGVSVGTWFGYRAKTTSAISSHSNPAQAVVPTNTLLAAMIERIRVPLFEADAIPVRDALAKVEQEINRSSAWEGRKVKVITLNSGEQPVTIILKDASIRTILKVIDEQTKLEHKIDGANLQITFYSNEDIIGSDNNARPTEAGILPQLPDPVNAETEQPAAGQRARPEPK